MRSFSFKQSSDMNVFRQDNKLLGVRVQNDLEWDKPLKRGPVGFYLTFLT